MVFGISFVGAFPELGNFYAVSGMKSTGRLINTDDATKIKDIDIFEEVGMIKYVFAYGSLMWNPGFIPVSSRPGLVADWRRCYCIPSVKFRGSPSNPAYVLGLRPGGHCVGMVLEIPEKGRDQILAAIDEREMAEPGYRKAMLNVDVCNGSVSALAYINEDVNEPQTEELLEAYEVATGIRGTFKEYVDNTNAFLMRLPSPGHWPMPARAWPIEMDETLPALKGNG